MQHWDMSSFLPSRAFRCSLCFKWTKLVCPSGLHSSWKSLEMFTCKGETSKLYIPFLLAIYSHFHTMKMRNSKRMTPRYFIWLLILWILVLCVHDTYQYWLETTICKWSSFVRFYSIIWGREIR